MKRIQRIMQHHRQHEAARQKAKDHARQKDKDRSKSKDKGKSKGKKSKKKWGEKIEHARKVGSRKPKANKEKTPTNSTNMSERTRSLRARIHQNRARGRDLWQSL